MDNTFCFSHLPSPEVLVQSGAVLPLPSQQDQLQARYNSLLTPDQLVPDLFTRIAQGLKPLKSPQAADLQPPSGASSPALGANSQTSRGEVNGQQTLQQAQPSATPNKPPTDTTPSEPEKAKTDKPAKDDAPNSAKDNSTDPAKAENGPRSAGKKPQPQYLTRDQLMTWQRQLRSDAPSERQKAGAEIATFLGKHPETMQNPLERRALAALTLNLLRDSDEVVRHFGLTILSLGRIQFTRAERVQSPYRELTQRVNRLLATKDPVYAPDNDERRVLLTLKQNWSALTTLKPAPPNTEALPA